VESSYITGQELNPAWSLYSSGGLGRPTSGYEKYGETREALWYDECRGCCSLNLCVSPLEPPRKLDSCLALFVCLEPSFCHGKDDGGSGSVGRSGSDGAMSLMERKRSRKSLQGGAILPRRRPPASDSKICSSTSPGPTSASGRSGTAMPRRVVA